MRTTASIFLSLAYCLTAWLQAQEPNKLSESLDKTVRVAEPNWRLSYKRIEDKTCIMAWQSLILPNNSPKKEEFWAVVKVVASAEDAAKELTKGVSAASIGYSAKLQGIGEEAYLWRGSPGAPVSMQFRRLNLIVKLSAPSENQARLLAKHIISAIASVSQ